MIDQEKVITSLECCKDVHQSGRWSSGCISCGYSDKHRPDCFLSLADDAVELLKEQPDIVRCRDCKYMERLPWLDDEAFKAMVCRKHNYTGMRKEDFFCADGERRCEND